MSRVGSVTGVGSVAWVARLGVLAVGAAGRSRGRHHLSVLGTARINIPCIRARRGMARVSRLACLVMPASAAIWHGHRRSTRPPMHGGVSWGLHVRRLCVRGRIPPVHRRGIVHGGGGTMHRSLHVRSGIHSWHGRRGRGRRVQGDRFAFAAAGAYRTTEQDQPEKCFFHRGGDGDRKPGLVLVTPQDQEGRVGKQRQLPFHLRKSTCFCHPSCCVFPPYARERASLKPSPQRRRRRVCNPL